MNGVSPLLRWLGWLPVAVWLLAACPRARAGQDGAALVGDTWTRYRSAQTEREEIEILIVNQPHAASFSRAEAEAMLRDASPGVTRKRAVRHALYAADWNDKIHIQFSLPAEDTGLGFLVWRRADAAQDSMWLFMPGYYEVRRVPLSSDQKLAGTNLNYEDVRELAGERTKHFRYETLSPEAIDGRPADVIAATPAPGAHSVYRRRKLWIDREWHFLVQVEFYDAQDRLWKLLHNSDVGEITPAVRRAGLTEMRDVQRQQATLLLITKRAVGATIPPRVFTQDYLEHPEDD